MNPFIPLKVKTITPQTDQAICIAFEVPMMCSPSLIFRQGNISPFVILQSKVKFAVVIRFAVMLLPKISVSQ
jgi:hypothetical protein